RKPTRCCKRYLMTAASPSAGRSQPPPWSAVESHPTCRYYRWQRRAGLPALCCGDGRKRRWEAGVERNKGRRARQGRGIVLMGAMVGSVLVMGCQPATRAVLASLAARDEGSIRPGKAGVAELADDQPIVRRATVQEVPPEQGMPRAITLLPPSQRAAAARAIRTVEPLGTVRAAASGPGVVVAEPRVLGASWRPQRMASPAPRPARPADRTARDFGAGCGRWLQ